jgi:MarR family transcriptional regulator for hemolysin
MRPREEPLGLELARTGRALTRAFNDALVDAGGSLPQWLILLALEQGDHATQRELAAAVGIEGATLTHHLHRMEADGLVERERASADRRIQAVTSTAAGRRRFAALRAVVVDFDTRLRAGFGDDELATLRALLGRARSNLALEHERLPAVDG